ncbi:hypothetical protein BaRGS_00011461 [Batillaria attramentaria]|uniref:Uncharacterized protein n=1 Tax=Batillaria attramentaria TaxID=370345 RepID=A0ABD0LCY6_9CAEN
MKACSSFYTHSQTQSNQNFRLKGATFTRDTRACYLPLLEAIPLKWHYCGIDSPEKGLPQKKRDTRLPSVHRPRAPTEGYCEKLPSCQSTSGEEILFSLFPESGNSIISNKPGTAVRKGKAE